MEGHAPTRRPAVARRTGYSIAAVVDGALLYAINAHPGWRSEPFLTSDNLRVLPLVILSLIAALIAVAAIGAMQGIGSKLNTTFGNVSNAL